MKNPLNRRLPRELKGEMGKYMVIFLFMMLTIGFTSGYFVANSSMLQASEESYDKYNIEDGHFVVKDEISASLQRKLEQEDDKIYAKFNGYIDGKKVDDTCGEEVIELGSDQFVKGFESACLLYTSPSPRDS